LLVTFGVLSFTIFGSIGRIGMQEEAGLSPVSPAPTLTVETSPATPIRPSTAGPSEATGSITLALSEFVQTPAGEFEKHLSGEVYDMFRADPELATVWREDRRGMRSVYLAGPYELTKRVLMENLSSGQELNVGILAMSTDAIRELTELMSKLKREPVAASA
jgi:hypothetical protein